MHFQNVANTTYCISKFGDFFFSYVKGLNVAIGLTDLHLLSEKQT